MSCDVYDTDIAMTLPREAFSAKNLIVACVAPSGFQEITINCVDEYCRIVYGELALMGRGFGEPKSFE